MRDVLRKIGAVGVLLIVLGALAPALPAQACAPEEPVPAASVVIGDCAEDGCGDCGLACEHGCCHAPHVSLPAATLAREPARTAIQPGEWRIVRQNPLSAPGGLERPPRA